jgi:hypothetical protein
MIKIESSVILFAGDVPSVLFLSADIPVPFLNVIRHIISHFQKKKNTYSLLRKI